MKDQTKVTLMVCLYTVGKKCPLLTVGKLKVLKCFSLTEPPLPYTHQKNDRFDRSVFKWWINRVFWPCHKNSQGYVKAVLLVDNFSYHNMV